MTQDNIHSFDKDAELERMRKFRAENPQPVRCGGYVVHSIGQTIWLTPGHNTEQTSDTKQ